MDIKHFSIQLPAENSNYLIDQSLGHLTLAKFESLTGLIKKVRSSNPIGVASQA